MVSKMTALHRRHVKLGARMGDLDGWMVPRFYSNAEDELNHVLRSVGICDVSHYGKIDVKGNGLDKFLDQNLTPGGVARRPGEVRLPGSASERNGSDLSLIYVCRLTREHALLVTEPFKSASVLDVEGVLRIRDGANLTNLSSILAAFTIAGPSSETVLRRLVEVDLSAREVRRPFCLEAGLAKTHSTIVRFDVGPSGGVPTFDIYCGRDYAEYVWDGLMEAGHEYDIAPFGLDAHDRLKGARGPS